MARRVQYKLLIHTSTLDRLIDGKVNAKRESRQNDRAQESVVLAVGMPSF